MKTRIFDADLFKGESYLVTGATSGIGYQLAQMLAENGATVVAHGREAAVLDAVVEQLPGVSHIAALADLSQGFEAKPFLRDIVAKVGPLNGFVHCAGLHHMAPMQVYRSAKFELINRVNVDAALSLASAFRQRDVHAAESSVVFLASVMGLVGQPAVSIYAATKGALIAATKSMALEFANDKIRVNTVSPGQVLTRMTERQKERLPDSQFSAIEEMHPLGLGEPEDVANAVMFLLSKAARWITGANFVVDGGYTAA